MLKYLAICTKIPNFSFSTPHTGLQVLSNLDPSTPIVEGDQITLTCRGKNKDVMDLVWRWLPAVPLPYQTNCFMEINAIHLPAGLFSES